MEIHNVFACEVYLIYFAHLGPIRLTFIKPCQFRLPVFRGLYLFFMRLLTNAAAPFRAACRKGTYCRLPRTLDFRDTNRYRICFIAHHVDSFAKKIIMGVSPSVRHKFPPILGCASRGHRSKFRPFVPTF